MALVAPADVKYDACNASPPNFKTLPRRWRSLVKTLKYSYYCCLCRSHTSNGSVPTFNNQNYACSLHRVYPVTLWNVLHHYRLCQISCSYHHQTFKYSYMEQVLTIYKGCLQRQVRSLPMFDMCPQTPIRAHVFCYDLRNFPTVWELFPRFENFSLARVVYILLLSDFPKTRNFNIWCPMSQEVFIGRNNKFLEEFICGLAWRFKTFQL